MPKLLLVDGLSIVRRVYAAVPGDDSPDKAAGAMDSSWGSIRRALKELSPTHFLAAFDVPGTTWRHALYPEYKAQRSPMPQPLRDALPAFLARLNAAGLRTVESPGVEADDVLATLALKAVPRGFDTIVLTTDKDMCGLVAAGVQVWDHFSSEWRDEQWINAKFGIPSHLMLDYLALMGDATDGIPGVAKVGAKTAAQLLNEHGSLEAVLAAAADIKGKLGENLRAQADIARLSRQLTQWKVDVPIALSPKDLRIPPQPEPEPAAYAFHEPEQEPFRRMRM